MIQNAHESLTLAAWVFRDPDAADQLLRRAQKARPAALIGVTWPMRREAPRRLSPPEKAPDVDPFGQSLLEVVVGVSLFLPLMPAAADPSVLADIGVPLRFVNGVRDEVTPGRSAIFVIASDGAIDLPDLRAGVLTCSLSAAVAEQVRLPG